MMEWYSIHATVFRGIFMIRARTLLMMKNREESDTVSREEVLEQVLFLLGDTCMKYNGIVMEKNLTKSSIVRWHVGHEGSILWYQSLYIEEDLKSDSKEKVLSICLGAPPPHLLPSSVARAPSLQKNIVDFIPIVNPSWNSEKSKNCTFMVEGVKLKFPCFNLISITLLMGSALLSLLHERGGNDWETDHEAKWSSTDAGSRRSQKSTTHDWSHSILSVVRPNSRTDVCRSGTIHSENSKPQLHGYHASTQI